MENSFQGKSSDNGQLLMNQTQVTKLKYLSQTCLKIHSAPCIGMEAPVQKQIFQNLCTYNQNSHAWLNINRCREKTCF